MQSPTVNRPPSISKEPNKYKTITKVYIDIITYGHTSMLSKKNIQLEK